MTSIVKEEQLSNTVSTDTIPPPSSPYQRLVLYTIIKHIVAWKTKYHEKINACIQSIVIEKRKNSITNEEDSSYNNNSNNNSKIIIIIKKRMIP